jgi:hypothetical protein
MTETFFENSHVKFEVLHPYKTVELTMTMQDYYVHYCRIWDYQLQQFTDFVNGSSDKFEFYECIYDATNRYIDVMFTRQNGNLLIDVKQTEDYAEDEFWTFVVESEHVPAIFDKIQSALKV